MTDVPRPPQAPQGRPPAWPGQQGAPMQPGHARPGFAPPGFPGAPTGAQQARAKAIELVDGEWHRLHPATPLLRGGLALIIFLGIVFSIFRDRLIAMFVPASWDPELGEDPFGDFVIDQLLWVSLGVIVFVLLGIALFAAAWRVHRFRITGDAVEVEQGILVKKHRRAPLARIQAINVQKPWFARLLGACKFEIQQAGADANVDLNYLSSSVADALRYEIMNRASGRSVEDAQRLAAQRDAAGGHGVVDDFLRPDAEIAHLAPDSLVRIPVQRIALSSLLDGWIVWGVLYLIGTLVLIVGFAQLWAVFALLPAAIAALAGAMRSLGAKLRYSIAATPDGIRLAYGLASTTTEIIPPGRIFALQIKQPLLWRPFGWWQVTATRAGSKKSDGSTGDAQRSQMAGSLLPVGDLRDVRTVVGLVLPELAQSPLIDQGLLGQAPDAFVTSPPRARAFRWFSLRRNGFHVHDAAFLLRRGRIWRSLQIVPQARVQSIAIQQGPIYGMARLAHVQFHVPDTVLSPGLGAVDQGDAQILFAHAMRTIKAGIDRDASESWAASLSRHAVLETAPAVQDGLMPAPRPGAQPMRPQVVPPQDTPRSLPPTSWVRPGPNAWPAQPGAQQPWPGQPGAQQPPEPQPWAPPAVPRPPQHDPRWQPPREER